MVNERYLITVVNDNLGELQQSKSNNLQISKNINISKSPCMWIDIFHDSFLYA